MLGLAPQTYINCGFATDQHTTEPPGLSLLIHEMDTTRLLCYRRALCVCPAPGLGKHSQCQLLSKHGRRMSGGPRGRAACLAPISTREQWG